MNAKSDLPTERLPQAKPQSFGFRAGLALCALLGLLSLAVSALHLKDFDAFAEQAAKAAPAYMIAAIAAQGLAFLSSALLWRTALSGLRTPFRLAELYPLTFGKMFADQALPSAGVSGVFFLTYSLTRRGVARDVAVAVFGFGAVSSVIAFLMAAMGGGFYLAAEFHSSVVALESLAYFGAFALALAALIWTIFSFRWTRDRIHRSHATSKLLEFMRTAMKTVGAHPFLLAKCTLYQLGARFFDGVTLVIAMTAVGMASDLGLALAAVSVASLAATIAPTPMGFGSFEGAMIGAFAAAGVDVKTALAATLLYRGLSLWLPLLPGFIVAQAELVDLRRRRA